MIETTTCESCGLALDSGAPCPRCLLGVGLGEDAAALEDLVGRTIEGKYRVERLLGRGGMGAVYLATHLGTERPVALKVLAPDLTDEEEFVERFRREAKAAGRLRHPNIVNVTDFGVADPGEAGELAYLVMEYLDGESLAGFVATSYERPLSWISDVVGQIAAAVDEAHRHGVIHRDLKPGNIWLVPNGRGHTVKVLDFGLAKLRATDDAAAVKGVNPAVDATPTLVSPSRVRRHGLWHSAARRTSARAGATMPGAPPSEADGLTRVGSILGTPHYMSPEQCRGERLDERSDVYSLGVIAYELLTGRPPFDGRIDDVVSQHLRDEPQLASAVRRSLPQSIDEVLLPALAKRPDARPSSAGSFASSLAVALETVDERAHSILARAVVVYGSNLIRFLLLSPLTGIAPFAAFLSATVVLSHFGGAKLSAATLTLTGLVGWILGGALNAILLVPTVAGALEGRAAAPIGRFLRRDVFRRCCVHAVACLIPTGATDALLLVLLPVYVHLTVRRPPDFSALIAIFWLWTVFELAFRRAVLAGSAALLEGEGLRGAIERARTLSKRLSAVYTFRLGGELLLCALLLVSIGTALAVATGPLPDASALTTGVSDAWAPVACIVALVAGALVLNPVIGICFALRYVKARRLGGEGLDDLLDDAEPSPSGTRAGRGKYVLRGAVSPLVSIVFLASLLFIAGGLALAAVVIHPLFLIGAAVAGYVLLRAMHQRRGLTMTDEFVARPSMLYGVVGILWDDVVSVSETDRRITIKGPGLEEIVISDDDFANFRALRDFAERQFRARGGHVS